MKTFAFLMATLVMAAPVLAQSTEFGVLFGGSKRIAGDDQTPTGGRLINKGFSFSNSTVDLYYAVEVDPGTFFKVNVGRINTPVGFREREVRDGETINVRRDVDGEVQHAEGIIEYRFSEPFGSTGLFVGVGVYRHSAEGMPSTTDYGFAGGVTADFPLSRRYGVIAAATYHQTYHEFRPRYLTISGGLRFAF
jgi:hypothetical protein